MSLIQSYRIMRATVFLLIVCSILSSCGKHRHGSKIRLRYQHLKDSILQAGANEPFDSTNIFDSDQFIPSRDSVDVLIRKMDSVRDKEVINNLNAALPRPARQSRLSFSQAPFPETGSEKPVACRERTCILFAEVIKSRQVLYLYLQGELVDSFSVSTGVKGYTTPSFSVRPSGPIFTKYTSRKFPGGDYQGLGNMPYAVFVKGGYAIHGTTPGNFDKLGTPASHGCIRLHPNDAKVFTELVKTVGLQNTWVTVREG